MTGLRLLEGVRQQGELGLAAEETAEASGSSRFEATAGTGSAGSSKAGLGEPANGDGSEGA